MTTTNRYPKTKNQYIPIQFISFPTPKLPFPLYPPPASQASCIF